MGPSDMKTPEVFVAEDIDVLNETIAEILDLGDEEKRTDNMLRGIIEESWEEEWEDYD